MKRWQEGKNLQRTCPSEKKWQRLEFNAGVICLHDSRGQIEKCQQTDWLKYANTCKVAHPYSNGYVQKTKSSKRQTSKRCNKERDKQEKLSKDGQRVPPAVAFTFRWTGRSDHAFHQPRAWQPSQSPCKRLRDRRDRRPSTRHEHVQKQGKRNQTRTTNTTGRSASGRPGVAANYFHSCRGEGVMKEKKNTETDRQEESATQHNPQKI